MQQRKALRHNALGQAGDGGDVAAGRLCGRRAILHRIAASLVNDRDRFSCGQRRASRAGPSLATMTAAWRGYKIGGQLRQRSRFSSASGIRNATSVPPHSPAPQASRKAATRTAWSPPCAAEPADHRNGGFCARAASGPCRATAENVMRLAPPHLSSQGSDPKPCGPKHRTSRHGGSGVCNGGQTTTSPPERSCSSSVSMVSWRPVVSAALRAFGAAALAERSGFAFGSAARAGAQAHDQGRRDAHHGRPR